ncbi:MAG: chorismate-binding protein [Candidatus Planktophila sp.]|nr:chorismate-binding protein [Candidatus Planktophila sp.]
MPYAENTSLFWMGGRLATDLVEVSHDPECLSDGGFWAVSTTFENHFTAAKFATVVNAPFPTTAWIPLRGNWSSSLEQDQYVGYVERIRSAVAEGWVYQVNACRRLTHADDGQSLRGLFSEILKNNPAPWASYLEIPGEMIASASPELFLSRNESIVKTSPIKGTQPANAQKFGTKDQAENVMIVDLMRNDFGRICKSGTVEVPRLLSSEEHPGLQHLVSDVQGELLDDISWSQIITALSPPGSVSGAPKSSALQVISENEIARGPYCGALGWIEGNQAVLSVAIRTFWKDAGINFGTGAGITWGSDATAEWEETQLKARRLISIAGGELL